MARAARTGLDLNGVLPEEVWRQDVMLAMNYDYVRPTPSGGVVLADLAYPDPEKTFGNYSVRMAGAPNDMRLWVNSTLTGNFYYAALDDVMYRRTFACYFTRFTTTTDNDAVSKLSGDFQYAEFAGCTFTNTDIVGDFAHASFLNRAVDGSVREELECVTELKHYCVFNMGTSLQGHFQSANFRYCRFDQVEFNGDFEQAKFSHATIRRSCLDNLANCGVLSPRVELDRCYVTSHHAVMRLIFSGVDIEAAIDWSHDDCIGGRDRYVLFQQMVQQLFDHVPEARRDAFEECFDQQMLLSTSFVDLVNRIRTLPAPELSMRERLFASPYAAAHGVMREFVEAAGYRMDRVAEEHDGVALAAGDAVHP